MVAETRAVTETKMTLSSPSIRIADVAKPNQTVVSLEHNATVGEAMQALAGAGILSAPVFISPDLEDLGSLQEHPQQRELLGWLDVQDILHSFLQHMSDKVPEKVAMPMLQLMSVLENEGPIFASKQVISIVGSKDQSLLYKGEDQTSLLTAIRNNFLQDGRSKPVHRIGIFTADGDVAKVVSQMDVLRYLVHRPELLATLQDQTLFTAGLLDGDRPITAVDINASTFQSLQLMHEHGRSSVAVLSHDGSLITNLSSSDLRFIQPDHLGVLALPVGEFLGLLHSAVYLGFGSTGTSQMATHPFFARSKERQPVPLITCTADTLVLEAMHRMVAKRVHRIYVVDDDTSQAPKPLAIITPTDILRLLSQRLSDSTQFA